MRNLYPLTAQAQAVAAMTAAHAAGERNRAPSGLGWTDLHVFEAPSIDYADAGLRLADAAAALAAIMPRIGVFNAGVGAAIDSGERDPYGSYETDAWCFGRSADCFIKLEPRDELVRGIWFELQSDDAEDAAALRAAIEAVHALAPSTIADYWLKFAGPAEGASLDEYFARLASD